MSYIHDTSTQIKYKQPFLFEESIAKLPPPNLLKDNQHICFKLRYNSPILPQWKFTNSSVGKLVHWT